MKRLLQILLITLVSTLYHLPLQAQSMEAARTLYKAGNYAEAKPLFEGLIRKSPNNSSLNQWYGVCLYETGEKTAAEKYLKFAASRKIQDAYLYLGKLYFDLYQFDEAVKNYNNYISVLSKAKNSQERIEAVTPALKKAELAARMLNRVEQVEIIDSLIVDKASFLSHYKLSPEFGTLHPYNELFPGDTTVHTAIYQNQRGDRIYYGAPTDSGRYQLQTRTRMVDNSWGEAVVLPENVNRGENINYPYLLSDGATLYFAAEGENSLGGYDIFVTRYNLSSNSYLAPENIGMPFNSIYNDYLLAIDETNNVGWFASDRFQPEDKVILYLFIPNSSKQIYPADLFTPEQRKAFAQITSIAATWDKTADYTELLHKIKTQESRPTQKKIHDFTFILTDQIIYTSLSDFESDEAKTTYQSARDSAARYAQKEEQLQSLRNRYAQQPEPQLANEIAQLEKEVESTYGKVEDLEIQARSQEINYLRTLPQ